MGHQGMPFQGKDKEEVYRPYTSAFLCHPFARRWVEHHEPEGAAGARSYRNYHCVFTGIQCWEFDKIQSVGYFVRQVVQPKHTVADVLNLEVGHLHKIAHTSWNARALHAIRKCRTKALGGHLDWCMDCKKLHLQFNSCRNRHCTTCQGP